MRKALEERGLRFQSDHSAAKKTSWLHAVKEMPFRRWNVCKMRTTCLQLCKDFIMHRGSAAGAEKDIAALQKQRSRFRMNAYMRITFFEIFDLRFCSVE